MGKVTPAFEYGATLGAMQRGFETMMREIAKGFEFGYSPPEKLTEEQILARNEMRSQALYKQRIESERKLGMAHVRSEARRVRRELGLDPRDLA